VPRIRTIKPEFWTDGTMLALPYEARLFYIGMWNHACDRGHLPDDPFGLKLKVLPADPVDGAALVQSLVDAGRVTRYVLPDRRPFLVIPRFGDHQRVDTRWNSRCPVCAHLDSPELTETHASLCELTQTQKEGKGGEGKGEERKGGAEAHPTPFCPNHPNGTDAPCRACGNARIAYKAHEDARKHKATQIPPAVTDRSGECLIHPGYPMPCHRCATDD